MNRDRVITGVTALALASGLLALAGDDSRAIPPVAGQSPSPTGSHTPTVWEPTAGTTWQWQLSGEIDESVEAEVFDVDLFDVPAETVASLQAKGIRVICYMSAGSWERWRDDAGRFPDGVKGKPLDEWPGEKWLDIRALAVLGPIMEDRLDECRDKGFDGVEFDNIDGWSNDTGFPLTRRDQKRYNLFLAEIAHERGLAAGLKNDPEQVRVLEPFFEFVVVEQCFQYRECGAFTPFIDAGKAVFEAEYELPRSRFCARANELQFSAMRKRYSLGIWRRPCWTL